MKLCVAIAAVAVSVSTAAAARIGPYVTFVVVVAVATAAVVVVIFVTFAVVGRRHGQGHLEGGTGSEVRWYLDVELAPIVRLDLYGRAR
jgi:hypothetical protein